MEIKNPQYFGQLLHKQGFRVWTLYMFKMLENRRFIEEELHAELFETFQYVYDQKENRQIINVPPRSGKTTLAKYFIAYCIAHNPKCNFIYTSFSQALLNDISRELAQILQHPIFEAMYAGNSKEQSLETKPIDEFWRNYLEENQGKANYTSRKIITEAGGVILFASVGSAITGFGAGIRGYEGFSGGLFIDDANKPADIHSELMREKVQGYYEETLLSRLNDSNIAIVNIQQRLHLEDLSGFLQKVYHFKTLKKPLLIDGVCQLKSQYTDTRIKEIAKNDFMFQAQYQQEPIQEGGVLFKKEWFRYYQFLPAMDYRCIYADTASKEGKHNDYTVIQCWGVLVKNGRRYAYLLDSLRAKMDTPKLIIAAKDFWQKHLEDTKHGSLRKFAIEDKSSGIGLIQILKDESNIPIDILKAEKDKVARVNDVLPRFYNEQVFFPIEAPFLAELEKELLQFNGEKGKKDQVDTLAYAIRDLLFEDFDEDNRPLDYSGLMTEFNTNRIW